jgi:hypothetical protein
MKTKLLLAISFLFISISISLAQGHDSSDRTDPLPGGPEPTPPPPSCISPAVPSISYYTLIPGFIRWYSSYGAIGYHIWVKKSGSSVISIKKTVSDPPPPNGIYTCFYTDLPTGTYTIYVSSFSSGCESGLSNHLSITTNGEAIPMTFNPGNDPYAFDIGNLADYNDNENDEDLRVTDSPNDHVSGIYPNPVSSTLNVSLPFQLSSCARFSVRDINGHAIDNLPISISLEGNAQLETSGISPGIYFLTVISGHNNFKQKFIKN